MSSLPELLSLTFSYTINGELGAKIAGQCSHRATLNASTVCPGAGEVPRTRNPGRCRIRDTSAAQQDGGGQPPCCGEGPGISIIAGNPPMPVAKRVCHTSRVRRRDRVSLAYCGAARSTPASLPAQTDSMQRSSCRQARTWEPATLALVVVVSLAAATPGFAFTWIADGAAVLPQQGPALYSSAIAQLAAEANLSTDPAAAAQYFLNPNATDSRGCTTIVVSVRCCRAPHKGHSA